MKKNAVLWLPNCSVERQEGLCCMCEVICWLFKSQIVLVFGQHLVSYVPGKFLHQTTMNLYKDIKEIQQGKMVSTKIKMITQLCDYCK